jgi:hypothetical protein
MLSVYADRFLVKNRFRFGPLHSAVKVLLLTILINDRISQWLRQAENNFHAILYINGRVAAFASGLVHKNGRLVVDRLNMLTPYARYSPGGLLISTMIRHITELNASRRVPINQMDLSQEGRKENSYKISYGGQLYYNYTFAG